MSTEELISRLKHPNPNLRNRAIWELAENYDQSTISQLMSLLGETDTIYRRAAVKALGAIGFDTIPGLVEASLNSDNVTVKGSAVKALAQVAINYPETPFPEEGLQGLKKALDDPNPVVHIASVMALGEIGSPAFDILHEALKTTDNIALAVSITDAFGSIDDSRAEGVLKQVIDDESTEDYVKESAISALSRLELVRNNQPSPRS